jgi:hypothetical protein
MSATIQCKTPLQILWHENLQAIVASPLSPSYKFCISIRWRQVKSGKEYGYHDSNDWYQRYQTTKDVAKYVISNNSSRRHCQVTTIIMIMLKGKGKL